MFDPMAASHYFIYFITQGFFFISRYSKAAGSVSCWEQEKQFKDKGDLGSQNGGRFFPLGLENSEVSTDWKVLIQAIP